MRLFVAIPLSAAVVSELSAVVARLRSSGDNLRWMEAASWHITLKFLGNTDAEQYQCLLARLGNVRSGPVPVHLAELGFFDRAGVFLAGVAPTPGLVSLAESIATATSQSGFTAEARPFHPHITLARAKGRDRSLSQPLHALQDRIQHQPAFSRFVASEFLLYESHLSPKGSLYEIRHHFPL